MKRTFFNSDAGTVVTTVATAALISLAGCTGGGHDELKPCIEEAAGGFELPELP